MKLSALLLAATIAGCASPPPAQLVIPPRLQVCPDAAPAPSPPPVPRTVGQVIAWSARVMAARNATADALAECRRRLGELVALVPTERVR